MINGNILILNENAEVRAHLDLLCSRVGTIYASSNFETSGEILKSRNINVLVVDYLQASYLSLNALLDKTISIVVTGLEEKKIEEIVNKWPLSRYIDYHITLSGE